MIYTISETNPIDVTTQEKDHGERSTLLVLGIANEDCYVCPKTAMPNPVEGFVWPSLGFSYSESILHTHTVLTISPYFDNLEFDVYEAGSPQCHSIMSITIAVRI